MTPHPENATRMQRFWWKLAQVFGILTEYCLSKVGPVWRSANGRVQFISDLEDRHLQNYICMLMRNGDQQKVLHLLLVEKKRRERVRQQWEDALNGAPGGFEGLPPL